MTEQKEINDIAKETLYVLDNFNPEFTSKISKNILNELKLLAQYSNKDVKINKTKRLKDQKILPETRDMISLLYYNYVAKDNEKKELMQKWKQNELKYQERLKTKYNLDYILNKKENNTSIVEYKKNIFQKILDKIKSIMNFKG